MYRIHPLGVPHPPAFPGSPAWLLPLGRGGPPLTFSKFGTSVRSLIGTETLLSMQRFIEKEREDGMTELDAKQDEDAIRLDAKQDEDAISALRHLFQDFERQLERDALDPDDHMPVSSTEVEEQKPEQDQVPAVHHAKVSNSTDDEEDEQQDNAHTKSEEEPRLYLCDDWIFQVEVMKKPRSPLHPQDKLRPRVAKNLCWSLLCP